MRFSSRARHGLLLAGTLALTLSFAACTQPERRPNVLWIVLDTVRADHIGLYKYERDTMPRLGRWAEGARVYKNCVSPAGYTLPSHASMFTGLLPSEHCTDNANPWLDDRHSTIAELLRSVGYRTYLYSANPYVSQLANLTQGFDLVEHPWSPAYSAAALEILEQKVIDEDQSSELGRQLRSFERGEGQLTQWNVKATGTIAQHALLSWLDRGDTERPFFAFLNYMEAHRPYVPPREYRSRFMSEEEVARSYRVDRSWIPMWEFTFGLRDYEDEELELTRATYDATLAELDDLLAELFDALERGGHLDDTVIVVTSDHGEHLGEKHMLDHQYSLFQPLLRVPLLVHYPERFAPGLEKAPVTTFDLFPTLLELGEVAPPIGLSSRAVSLLHPEPSRPRLAEETAPSPLAVGMIRERHPDWDPSPWQRHIEAWYAGAHKLIRYSDGERLLFDYVDDPHELLNRSQAREEIIPLMEHHLAEYRKSLRSCERDAAPRATPSPEQLEMLRSLGYAERSSEPPGSRQVQ